MSNIELNITELPENISPKGNTKKAENKWPFQKGKPNALLLAYLIMYLTLRTSHDTDRIDAKKIEYNDHIQRLKIRQEAQEKFETISRDQVDKEEMIIGGFPFVKSVAKYPQLYHKLKELIAEGKIKPGFVKFVWIQKTAKALNNILTKLQNKNQIVAAERNIMEDQLNVTRQGAQVAETNLNSAVNQTEQTLHQGSSLMQMLMSLTNQISRI